MPTSLMPSLYRMYKTLRRLASWDDERLRKLEKLLDDDAQATSLIATLCSSAFEKKWSKAIGSGALDPVIDRVLKQREKERQARLLGSCQSEGVVFMPEARIENLANDPTHIRIGAGTNLRAELLVFRFGGTLEIGKHCYIGENSRVWAGERVSIGDHVLISHDVFITDCNAHEFDAGERAVTYQRIVNEGHPAEKGNVLTKPVTIGAHAWINPQCVILPGVTIGEGAIIGAGSVVTEDIPCHVLAAGNPARVIRPLVS